MSGTNPELTRAKSYFKGNTYGQLLSMAKKDAPPLKDIVQAIEEFVKGEGRGITTSQLRNIFAKVKSEQDANRLQLMRPVLAYTAARQGTQGAKIIIALLDDLIQQVTDDNQLKSFKAFMESVVGYHKFHHPK